MLSAHGPQAVPARALHHAIHAALTNHDQVWIGAHDVLRVELGKRPQLRRDDVARAQAGQPGFRLEGRAFQGLEGGFGKVRLGNVGFGTAAYFATADYISMHNHDTGTSSDALFNFFATGGTSFSGTNLTTGAENYDKNVYAARGTIEVHGTDFFARLSGDWIHDKSSARGGHRLIPSLLSAAPVLSNVYDTRGGLVNPFADRARFYADPAFVKAPLAGLLSDEYADAQPRSPPG